MDNQEYRNRFDSALGALRCRPQEHDLTGFEHGVWSEIALQGQPGFLGSLRSAWAARRLLPVPVSAAFATIAVLAGVSLGHVRAAAYDRQASLSLEQRYVESIHPVMRSAIHLPH